MVERQNRAYMVKNHIQQKGSKENIVAIRSKAGEEYAVNTLGDKALRIYLTLTANKDGFTCLVSNTQIAGKALPKGMSRSTYTRAMKELEENGFLVKREDSDVWDFYDRPQEVEIREVKVHKDAAEWDW